MTVAIGTQIGSYQITSVLGKGGMGEVYRARDAKLKRDVAIKVLPEEFSHDPDRVSRFRREAELLASLNHPNVGSIYDLHDANGLQFLVLELVEGETLADRLQHGPLPADEALHIARQICEALESAHEKGVVHRDLKPANIKVLPDNTVKVLDFGLAKAMEKTSSNVVLSNSPTMASMGATNAGVIMGTAAYMSPEQARGLSADARSDVFSFGCVLYEMLTGRQAFQGDTISDILASVLKSEPDLNLLPANMDSRLRDLLRRSLAKNPKKRWYAIGDVRFELEDVIANPASAAPAALPKGQHFSGIVVALLCVVFVALAAVAATSLIKLYNNSASHDFGSVKFSISAPEKTIFMPTPLSPHATVSPDGRSVAFIAQSEGLPRVWVRSLDSQIARPVSGTEGVIAGRPFWSPDGRSIGFFTQGRLKKVDISGGPSQTICETLQGVTGTWNAAGVIIFDSGILKTVAATGGQPEPLTTLDQTRGELSHIEPTFLPDGDHFLFLSRTGSLETFAVMVGSLKTRTVKLLMNASTGAVFDSGFLLFLRDRSLMAQHFDPDKLQLSGDAFPIAEQIQFTNGGAAFWASGNGTLVYRTGGGGDSRKLTWFSREGKILGTVGPIAAYRNPELSPDGKRIAVSRTDPQTQNEDIWVMDVARGVPTRLTFDPGFDDFPLWTPNGEQLVFGANRNKSDNLLIKSSTGVGAEDVLLKSAAIPRDLSNDNRYLVYGVTAGSELMILPLFGDRKPFPYLQKTSFKYFQPRISPDGKWLVFYSDESGAVEVYVQSFPTPSAKYQVSTHGGVSPRWSRDGKEIFYVDANRKLTAVPVRQVGAALDISLPVTLFDTGAPPSNTSNGKRQQYDVTADGQRFLVNFPAEDTEENPVTVVVNWLAALKQK